jgi:hypothetical protein
MPIRPSNVEVERPARGASSATRVQNTEAHSRRAQTDPSRPLQPKVRIQARYTHTKLSPKR